MDKVKPQPEPTPHDWDPIRCSRKDEDLSAILPPGALRLFEAQVKEIRAKQERRRVEDVVDLDE